MKRVSVYLLLGAIAGSMAAAPVSARNVVADLSQIADVMKRNGYTVEVNSNENGSYIHSSRG
ncbi:MAG TPA: hypothetical protein VMN38_02130, partial [Sphingomicrobium sp.]|nr:hypothetical protein [Sphingomicrobium sp.]